MGRKRLGPFQFYVGSARGWGCKKVLSGVHHLAIIKQVINIFLRRMVRKQAADDCPELRALRRHLYDSALFWLGVCPAGQKFRLSSPPSFLFHRWELGRGLECRGLESGVSSSPLLPLSPRVELPGLHGPARPSPAWAAANAPLRQAPKQ